MNHDKNLYGTGGVIRNFKGEVSLAFSKSIWKPPSVLEGELLAIREGLKMVDSRNIDLSPAVQAVTQPHDNLNYSGVLAINRDTSYCEYNEWDR